MSSVEKIKDRLGIVDVVSSYMKLEKAGSNYRARCPFHNEKTPSFFVSPVRGTYHCFGCNKGGDIFSFVEELEGIDFKGALKILADKAGIQLIHTNPKERDEQEKLYRLMEDVTTFFQINLTQNSKALAYLYKRGLKASTLKNFRIGFAEDNWDSVCKFLKTKGYSDMEMEKAGLVIKKDDAKYYDRFRSRIMFPISDSAGRVIAFSGRIFQQTESDIAVGKYINSPASALYNKSKILYGYDKAKAKIRKTDACIVVEGQMDLLMAHQIGQTNSVALSGTALTSEQVNTIKRLAGNIILSFDPDQAGLTASGRGALIALQSDMNVKAIALPAGLDPADIILNNPEEWKKLVNGAQHIVNFYVDMISRQNLDPREFRLKVGSLVLPFVKLIRNKIDQEYFIGEVSKKLNVSPESVKEELEKTKVSLDLQTEDKVPDTKKEKNRYDVLVEQIASILLWQSAAKEPIISINKEKERLKDILGDDKVEEIMNTENGNKMIFNAEVYFGENGDINTELNELLEGLEREILKDKLEATEIELRDAEKSKNHSLAANILKKFQELSKKINNFK